MQSSSALSSPCRPDGDPLAEPRMARFMHGNCCRSVSRQPAARSMEGGGGRTLHASQAGSLGSGLLLQGGLGLRLLMQLQGQALALLPRLLRLLRARICLGCCSTRQGLCFVHLRRGWAS